MLPCALATEVYQLLALPALLEKAGEVASPRRDTSLLNRCWLNQRRGPPVPSVGQQKQGRNRKRNKKSGSKLGSKAALKGASSSVYGAGKTGDWPQGYEPVSPSQLSPTGQLSLRMFLLRIGQRAPRGIRRPVGLHHVQRLRE